MIKAICGLAQKLVYLRFDGIDFLHYFSNNGLAETSITTMLKAKDGMDIALINVNHKKMQLHFSGAYRPLFLIRDRELQEIYDQTI